MRPTTVALIARSTRCRRSPRPSRSPTARISNADPIQFFEQLHDVTPGILPSGLFWTAQLPDDSFSVSKDGTRAYLRAHGICLGDTFRFLSKYDAPCVLDIDAGWHATGKAVPRGNGSKVAFDDPTSFEGNIAPAKAWAHTRLWEMGYEAEGKAHSNKGGWAQLGYVKNGKWLKGSAKK